MSKGRASARPIFWEDDMARPRKIAEAPETADAPVEIVCTIHNVHLGDGRKLYRGDSATVTPELAAMLIERKQAKRV